MKRKKKKTFLLTSAGTDWCNIPTLLDVEVQPLGQSLNASHRSRSRSAFHCMTSLKGHEPSAKNTLHCCSADVGFLQLLFVDSHQQL